MSRWKLVRGVFTILCMATLFGTATAAELSDALEKLDTTVLSDPSEEDRASMVPRDIERRRLLAIQRENQAWGKVKTRKDWEQFRDVRIESLRKSLGSGPTLSAKHRTWVTRRISGDGYQIENLVYESRPGLLVTANLYSPSKPGKARPAILIAHSHHNPKTQSELQDMGMIWARQGCVVMVIDMLGHGERRQHPFVSSDDYAESFRVSRQDYYFRYNVGLQLQLVGESLMGWMAWDLISAVDLLHAREDVDQEKIILLGAVAGGGDPAGVTAALDSRIAAVAPFNFGGPQGDYKTPDDPENEFYFFGSAYWESTRCLRLGGSDGFAHWVIVGSVAPRGLIYSHEFSWDPEHDPAWPRLKRIFELNGAPERLGKATGKGTLKGRPPESSHCNNIGEYHRRGLYPWLAKWFDMKAPDESFRERRETKELLCLRSVAGKKIHLRTVHKQAEAMASESIKDIRKQIDSLEGEKRRQKLRADWSSLLGNVTPDKTPKVTRTDKSVSAGITIERIALETEPGIVIPLVLLRSAKTGKTGNAPVVVAIAKAGKQELLKHRAEEIAELLAGGAAVGLPDLRGTGETRAGGSYGYGSTGTTLGCRNLVLGQTTLGSRLHDLRAVLQYVRDRKDLGGKLALWGTSLVDVNPENRSEVVPMRVDNPNLQAEPSAGLLVLLAALYEDDVQAVAASGSLVSFRSVLGSPFLYVAHDSIIPGVTTTGDLGHLVAALAPQSVRLENMVNGLNRRAGESEVEKEYAFARAVYREKKVQPRLSIPSTASAKQSSAQWLLEQLGSD